MRRKRRGRALERLDRAGAQWSDRDGGRLPRLDIPGVEDLVGRGVRYGSPSGEAVGYAGRRVAVVGGANSAGQAALHLAGPAAQVTMLVRGDSMDRAMSRY